MFPLRILPLHLQSFGHDGIRLADADGKPVGSGVLEYAYPKASLHITN